MISGENKSEEEEQDVEDCDRQGNDMLRLLLQNKRRKRWEYIRLKKQQERDLAARNNGEDRLAEKPYRDSTPQFLQKSIEMLNEEIFQITQQLRRQDDPHL